VFSPLYHPLLHLSLPSLFPPPLFLPTNLKKAYTLTLVVSLQQNQAPTTTVEGDHEASTNTLGSKISGTTNESNETPGKPESEATQGNLGS
jgi:hypothetical protein